jgi:hypothetical protein
MRTLPVRSGCGGFLPIPILLFGKAWLTHSLPTATVRDVRANHLFALLRSAAKVAEPAWKRSVLLLGAS